MSRSYKSKDLPQNWGGLSKQEVARRLNPRWRSARHKEQASLSSDYRAQEMIDKLTTTGGKTGLRKTDYSKAGFAKCR